MTEPTLGRSVAAVARSAIATAGMVASGRLAQPRDHIGTEITFADGTRSVVFRETVARTGRQVEPVVLVVCFRLRYIGRNRLAHWVFRRTCVVNTPLFAGFPGFRTKLWLADRDGGDYRGIYDWDGAAAAEHYAMALCRVLAPVSVSGSVRWRVIPATHRDDYLVPSAGDGGPDWWRTVAVEQSADVGQRPQ